MLFLELTDLIFTFWKNLEADRPKIISTAIWGAKLRNGKFMTTSDLYYGLIDALFSRKFDSTVMWSLRSRSVILMFQRVFITNLVKFALPFDPYYWVLTNLPTQIVALLGPNALKSISTFIF